MDQSKPKEIQAQYEPPDGTTLEEAGQIRLKDEDGEDVTFRSLYTDVPGRRLIVFIRHFYCGNCEDYVRTLAHSLPPSRLSAANPPITLSLIGCGQPVCIPDYRKRTMDSLPSDAKYTIYCNPDCSLYAKLNMVSNLSRGNQKPGYIAHGLIGGALSGIGNAIMSGKKALMGGKASQNGGEWLFEDGELRWCHRMRNTVDHAEIEELTEVLGLG